VTKKGSDSHHENPGLFKRLKNMSMDVRKIMYIRTL